jgi:hypothetical protein
MVELTVSVKTEDATYKQKFICYEEITCSSEDPHVKKYINQALKMLNIQKDDIEDLKVRFLLVVR